MSQTELDRFIAEMERDPELAREFRRFASDIDAAVRWANFRGYQFTREEADRVHRLGELSEDDLDMVAGGWTSTDPPPTGGGG